MMLSDAVSNAERTHQAAAAVGVGTCWSWETAARLPSARRRNALQRPRGRRGAGYIMAAARLQLVFILRLPEGPRATELATIKQQNSRKKSVKTKNTKSKKNYFKV